MKPFEVLETHTTTDLKRSSNKIYNQVMIDGAVFIEHRDRPDMVLITLQELENLMAEERLSVG